MRQLDENVRKNGFDYSLIERETVNDRAVAIYGQYPKREEGNSDPLHIIAYEVFVIPIRKKDVMTPTKVLLPAGEVFPGNEYFGTNAKSIHAGKNPESALIRAQEYYQQFKQHILHEVSL